ncbi:armadillo-type protein [Roridomyces roridus]|uniref:Armadillo-type protein n=1 Tax=Roridomyces roridus TaxID=1738132 RepID=A0AAD7FRD9_9AGAR|nr:armadillo-type protein [Roridomyces roridus]
MESVVPQEITAELTQILSNLLLGDNEIRSNAETAVNERLAHTPELYLLALAQFAISADTEVMRSFSLVLLRRLLFRPAPTSPIQADSISSNSPVHQQQQAYQSHRNPRLTLYDNLSSQTLTTLERLLLHSLQQEPAILVRRKTVTSVCDLANEGMLRGRPWHALQALAFNMTQAGQPGATDPLPTNVSSGSLRESAYRVFAGCPNLVMDLQTDAVLGVFQRGLQDVESVDVKQAALLASVAYLNAAEPGQLAQSLSLMHPMLDTLHTLAQMLPNAGSLATAHPSRNVSSLRSPSSDDDGPSPYANLTAFLTTLTPLCSSHPSLFAPHLQALLSFFPALILPSADPGPTPTVSRPFPTDSGESNAADRQGAFVFPPPQSPHAPSTPPAGAGGSARNTTPTGVFDGGAADLDADERQTLRLAALEFMVSLSEARPGMVKRVDGWVAIMVRACLEGMGEFEDSDGLGGWLEEDPSVSSAAEAESAPAMYEQSLDRLACAVGGRSVLPPAFQYIPSMMASYDWRVRHAGLMAVAAIAEGTAKVMENELGKVVELVTPMFHDLHPRVRYAACQCVGQLCTDLEEVIQERYHQQLFAVLIPTLEDREPRVHSHAAAALINFCEGVERDVLLPYLDPIVERLLKLLDPAGDPAHVRRYVQEQAITTLAMVADASETTFGKYYPSIMPLLLNVLRNADGSEYQKLRAKAMECAGLIAIAVGPEMFLPDAHTLVDLLMRLQKAPTDPSDTQFGHYLIATWAKVCQAMGPEFEPYLPVVMPTLLATASAKADISVYDEEEDKVEDREGWETVSMDGQTLGIRTSAIEEKCQAFETLVIYCSTLGPRFAPYLSQSFDVTLPSLRFYFHDGVREACALLIPMLLASGKNSGTLTNQMVTATFLQIINGISTEHDASFLSSLYKCFNDSLRVIGGPITLSAEFQNGVMEATKRQLHSLADKRRARKARPASDMEEDREDMALLEEIEDFALEDMAKMLTIFDPSHPLLVAVSSVKDLGFNQYDSDEDRDDEG